MDFPFPREGYGIVCGAVYFCVDDVLDKIDGVVGDSVNLRTRQDRNVLYSVGNGSAKNPPTNEIPEDSIAWCRHPGLCHRTGGSLEKHSKQLQL